MTVRNDPVGCAVTLDSLSKQSRVADEIVVVDGGSTDDTVAVIKRLAQTNPRIRCVETGRGNIAQGRNLAARMATGDILACIDGGCRAEPDWLERLTRPFELDAETEFVAGFYRIEPRSLLETVVGLATMRGQLEPIKPESFNPSARSLACTKSLWQRVGGWPEWLRFSEDTLFDHKVRALGVKWHLAEDAVVHWRPRTSLRAVGRQFYNYGTGRGHTQIGAKSFAYNLRNVALCAMTAGLCGVTAWAALVLAAMLMYFYVWTFHRKAVRVARWVGKRTLSGGARPTSVGRWRAYPLCLIVMWVVLFSNLVGYLVGSWQRWRDRDRFRGRMEAYLAGV
ncbi:MAG: glycosyltransferase [Planctomycetes bacterium]|nr:glycosyltransferase [Planctomycetota bacterium]